MNTRITYTIGWGALFFSVPVLIHASDWFNPDSSASFLIILLYVAAGIATYFKAQSLADKYSPNDKVLDNHKDVEWLDFNISLFSIPFAIVMILILVFV